MEVIDIDLDNIPLSNETRQVQSTPSVNFGGGIELLMNEKKRNQSGSTRIDLDELDHLEKELNDLSGKSTPAPETKQLSGLNGFSNFFNMGQKPAPTASPDTYESDAKLGNATKETVGNESSSRTWDGFSKAGEDIPKERASSHLSEREKRRKKRMMIKKMEEWHEKGTVKHISHFNMDSNYDEVEDEYEGALEDKRKKDSIKLQGWWFTTVINTMEYGNALLNPFDLNLDGWGEQVSEDLDSYEEIFAELHEKYKGGKMAPEVSLLLRLGFSAAVVNMSNKMLSSATPGFNDVMKQSPELMKMFTNAAMDTMSKQNSAFDFAKTMLNPPEQVNTKFGPPPAPLETKQMAPPQRPGMAPQQRPGMAPPGMQFTQAPGNRPDLAAAANPMFREQGIDLNNRNEIRPPTQTRPEMRGPQTTDIDQLLSGLKTKKDSPGPPPFSSSGNNSMISVSSLKDLDDTNMPKKTNRRGRPNKSDKNTVSLDI
jgi:hypothetical protein